MLLQFLKYFMVWMTEYTLLGSSRDVLCCAVLSHSVMSDFVTPWTVAHQAPLSMGILQARTLEWVAMPSSRGSSQPGIKPRSLALQADSLPSQPLGKPKNTGEDSLPLLRESSRPRNQTQFPALQADSSPAELPGNPLIKGYQVKFFDNRIRL